MSFTPTKCELLLFDLHTCLAAVDDPSLFQPPFRFLADSAVYSSIYATEGFQLETEHFTLRPLSKEEIKSNHFWSRVGDETAWAAHRPLVALPRDLNAELSAPDLDVPPMPVRAWAFVWPWGWSANLAVTLQADTQLTTLRDIVGGFRTDHPRCPFLLDGKPVKPSALFRRLEAWISGEIYQAGAKAHARMPLGRHFIVSIQEAEGEIRPYRRTARFTARPLDDADRAMLHSVLLGRDITPKDLSHRESDEPRPFLLTEFTGSAFALTDWDRGSLLVLPGLQLFEESPEDRSANREHCLSGNVKNCAMLSMGLAAVVEGARAADTLGKNAEALALSAQRALKRMGGVYRNHLCNGYLMSSRVQYALAPWERPARAAEEPALQPAGASPA